MAFDLDGKIDMILDGGAAEWGLESTIVDVSITPPMILRPGAITKEMMEPFVGEVTVDPAILQKPQEGLRPKAPGMKYTHYSPRAEVYLVRGEGVQAKINALTAQEKDVYKRQAVVLHHVHVVKAQSCFHFSGDDSCQTEQSAGFVRIDFKDIGNVFLHPVSYTHLPDGL